MGTRHIRPLVVLACLWASDHPATAQGDPKVRSAEGRAKADSARFSALYTRLWDEFLYTRPDTACILAQAMERDALAAGQVRWAAKAIDLQAITWYIRGAPLKAADQGLRAIPIYEARNDSAGLAGSLGNTGTFLVRGGRYDSALVVLNRALQVLERSRDTTGTVNAYNSIGSAHLERGDLHRALDAYRAALHHAEATGDSALIAIGEGNLGGAFAKQDEFTTALTHFHRAAAIFRHRGDMPNLIVGLINIGGAYGELNDTTRALSHLREARSLALEVGDVHNLASSLIEIGLLQERSGDHAGALTTYKEGLRMTQESQDAWARSQLLTRAGTALLGLGRMEAAAAHGEDGLALARAHGIITPLRDAAELLSKVYRAQGRWQQAMEAQLLFTELRDSLNSKANERAVIGFDLRRTYEKQALADSLQFAAREAINARELREQKLVRNVLMGGFALVALFAGIFLLQRNRISKAKARSEELLLNILPEEVAEELKAKGEADAVQIDQVTVLFTDFKGFTALSEHVTPKELVRDLNECFSAFDRITTRHGIEKIKTIGDAYMAAGGLPTPNITHATDVIQAALEMRDFIAEGKARKIATGAPFFEIRIGVHTGPVVAGIVGVKKFQYDIWGDTVNTASRMESSGAVGQVNISEATYRIMTGGRQERDHFVFTPRGKVHAKGKGELEMYFVERA